MAYHTYSERKDRAQRDAASAIDDLATILEEKALEAQELHDAASALLHVLDDIEWGTGPDPSQAIDALRSLL